MRNIIVFAFLISMMMAFLSGCGATIWEIRARDKQRRIEYCEQHRDMSKSMRDTILLGSIRIGMTTEQARASWGDPRGVNRTIGSWGVSEQWVYGHYEATRYLYFENGILETVQD